MPPDQQTGTRPRYGLLVFSLVGLGAIASAAPSGCHDMRCCNDCGRNFYVGKDLADPVAWVANIQDGASECEIDGVEPTFAEGVHTLWATVAVRTDDERGSTYQLTVVAHDAGDVSDALCEDVAAMGVDELRDAELEPGTRVCVVGPIVAETLCTQRACALDS